MPSIEALAMAGADCNKCEIHLEDVEKRHTIYKTRPQYLLADEGTQSGKKKKKGGGLIRKLGLGRDGKEVSNKEEEEEEGHARRFGTVQKRPLRIVALSVGVIRDCVKYDSNQVHSKV